MRETWAKFYQGKKKRNLAKNPGKFDTTFRGFSSLIDKKQLPAFLQYFLVVLKIYPSNFQLEVMEAYIYAQEIHLKKKNLIFN